MKSGKVLCFVVLLAILGLPWSKPGKIQKVVMCAHTTNQWKHCDYVIQA